MDGLSFRTSWRALKDHFRQAGTVVSSKARGGAAMGRSTGCGFVVFSTAEEAARAFQILHASVLNGKSISVRAVRAEGATVPGDSVEPDLPGLAH